MVRDNATWEKYWNQYKTKARYYAKRAGREPDLFPDIDQFKSQFEGYKLKRTKPGPIDATGHFTTISIGDEEVISFLAQKAGFNATMKQVKALQRGYNMLTSGRVVLRTAVEMFDPNNKEADEVLKLADKMHIETEEDLRQAALDHYVTLSEVNIILLRKFDYGESEDRKRWISQHVFGSD